jgi:probable F420-dependent oxidoreductase
MPGEVAQQLGHFGIWRGAPELSGELASEIERLGFGALWVGVSPDGDLVQVEELLDATGTLMVGTSIVNMWKDDAHTVAASFARLEERHPGRFVLGVGAGHREATQQYAKPHDTLVAYVDTLLGDGVPAGRLMLAALGPRVLRLAAERTAGALPYLVTPEHTRQAREIMGPAALLAPEQKVVVETDLARARAIGRDRVRNPYLGLINYTSNLRRLGWGEDDLADGGSDALVDALAVHGSADQVAAQLRAHLEAGADHVAIQALTETGGDPVPSYRALASALDL